MCATEMLKAISMKKKKKSVHVEEKDSDNSASDGSASNGSGSDESSSDEADGSDSPRAQRRKAHKLLQDKKEAAEYQQAILDDIRDKNQSSSSDVSHRSQVANACSSLVGFVLK